MRTISIYIFFIFLSVSVSHAQIAKPSIYNYEDSLKNLGTTITNDTSENNRITANYTFVKTLVNALKEKNSFNYPFNKLNNIISIKMSSDKKFRIFTWFVMNGNGSFRYYGALQLNNPNKLDLIPLIDNSQNLKPDASSYELKPNEWLGAVYYDIVPVTGKTPYYLLLGWKGQSFEHSSKVIEVLHFKGDEAVFGSPVLQSEAKSNVYNHRKIFNFASNASMLLRYLKDDKIIVFDHLVPPNEQSKELTNLYAPDLSYDAYRFKNGKWIYQEDVKLKNLPAETDDLLVDPSTVNPGTAPIRYY
jgi:hypothetical protein